MQERIGTTNEDGSIKTWPGVSLAGQPYERTQDRLGISATQFVVLDRFLTAVARDALLAQLRLTPPSKDK